VGPPVSLATLELGRVERPTVDACADLSVAHGTSVNAVAVTFQAHLYPSCAHTLDPWMWPSSSWATSVWVLPDAVWVSPGDRLRVRYSRRVPGRADGLTCDASPVSGDATVAPERHDIHLGCP
jgi:hypothetical protein